MAAEVKSFMINLPVPDSIFSFSEAISSFYESGELTDAAVLVGDVRIDVHKVILCAASTYLEELFDKSSNNTITIDDISYEDCKLVIEFIYSGRLPQDVAIAMKLLPMFSKLKLMSGLELIASILSSSIHPENCITYMLLAKQYDLSSLYEATYAYALKNLELCELSDASFVKLSIDEIKEFLKDDKLNISENKVFAVVLSWLRSNAGFKSTAETLFAHVRYVSMKQDYLESMKTDELVLEMPACTKFIEDGLSWHRMSPEEQKRIENSNTVRRLRDVAAEDD